MKSKYLVLALCLALPLCLRGAEPSATIYLTLDSCLQLARANHADVRKQALQVEQAEQVRKQALTKYFPQVQATAVGYHALQPLINVGIDDIGNASVRNLLATLYGNYGAALGLDNSLSLFQHGVSAGVTAVQPVYAGGRVVTGNKLAQVGVEAAQLKQEIVLRDVLEQVETNYWLIVGLQTKQQVLLTARQMLDTLSVIVSSAVRAGLVPPTDSMQVIIRQQEMSKALLQVTNGTSLAQQALCLSLAIPYSDSIFFSFSQLPDSPIHLLPVCPEAPASPSPNYWICKYRLRRWSAVW